MSGLPVDPPDDDDSQQAEGWSNWSSETAVPEEDAWPGDDIEWPGDDIEAAYRRALDTLESVEWGIAAEEANAATTETGTAPEPPPIIAPTTVAATETNVPPPAIQDTPPTSLAAAEPTTNRPVAAADLSPRQILEAVLFVGGTPLTSKKLCSVLRGDFEPSFIEATIESLNQQYARENRPYEIRLLEGGYSLQLRDEFERIRDKVFGLGPKEVRLSQDALEVLALVAYRQPITREEIESQGKTAAGAMLRQLLRRELIAVDRDPRQPKEVRYRTTDRFLSLFGLGSLDELPHADELSYK